MLLLRRHITESILIGEDVEVVITDIQGGAVQIGIIAPKSIPVHRKEVYESIHHKEASLASGAYSLPNQTDIPTSADNEKGFCGHKDESMLISSEYYLG